MFFFPWYKILDVFLFERYCFSKTFSQAMPHRRSSQHPPGYPRPPTAEEISRAAASESARARVRTAYVPNSDGTYGNPYSALYQSGPAPYLPARGPYSNPMGYPTYDARYANHHLQQQQQLAQHMQMASRTLQTGSGQPQVTVASTNSRYPNSRYRVSVSVNGVPITPVQRPGPPPVNPQNSRAPDGRTPSRLTASDLGAEEL